jgi:hypothetical protein
MTGCRGWRVLEGGVGALRLARFGGAEDRRQGESTAEPNSKATADPSPRQQKALTGIRDDRRLRAHVEQRGFGMTGIKCPESKK